MSSPSLPPLPDEPLGAALRVVVISCSDLAYESAAAIEQLPAVDLRGVVIASGRSRASVSKRLKLFYRRWGVPGLVALPFRKAWGAVTGGRGRSVSSTPTRPHLRCPVHHTERFESAEGLATLRALEPDLIVVDGTYILKPEVFLLPRFGSINLHCGKLPEYPGAPPAFWELLNGETQVGVTVHRVTALLDAGPILSSASVPLELAPPGDPLAYVRRLWLESLRPVGMRLICETLDALASGRAEEREQGAAERKVNRMPDYAAVKRLRAVVRHRRAGATG